MVLHLLNLGQSLGQVNLIDSNAAGFNLKPLRHDEARLHSSKLFAVIVFLVEVIYPPLRHAILLQMNRHKVPLLQVVLHLQSLGIGQNSASPS